MNIRPDVSSGGDQASLAPKKLADNTQESLHKEFSDFIGDVESISQKTMQIPHDDVKAIRDQLNERISRAKAAAEAAAHAAAESAQRNTKKIIAATNHQVHKRPFYALGVSAVVAVALGFFLGQRKQGATKV
jgi:ElaB/YqjD/DUF883 family membrane-anchored ribosome-binding protein